MDAYEPFVSIGVALAEELLSRGGKTILDEVYRQSGQ